MADTLTTITKLIQSPPGQLAAGGVLGGIVWKFFERVEAVLTDQTKLEIAASLFDVRVANKWRSSIAVCTATLSGFSQRVRTLAALATGVIGCLATFGPLVTSLSTILGVDMDETDLRGLGVYSLFVCCLVSLAVDALIDYRGDGSEKRHKTLAGFIVFFPISMSFPFIMFTIVQNELTPGRITVWRILYYFPYSSVLLGLLLSTSWLWLYGVAVAILMLMRRFDIGFAWFNRHFDIEKKPLQSIGLVAGALVAVVYWAAVIVGRAI
jgi:hypothetical protein